MATEYRKILGDPEGLLEIAQSYRKAQEELRPPKYQTRKKQKESEVAAIFLHKQFSDVITEKAVSDSKRLIERLAKANSAPQISKL